MAETVVKRSRARLVTWIALVLSLGAVAAALIGAVGAGQGWWPFRPALAMLRYFFLAAAAGGLVALVAMAMARRGRETKLIAANAVALVVALGFVAYLGTMVRTAKSVPAIHDISTNLGDVPQFSRLEVRADNLESIPDMGKPELKAMDAEARWKAVHRLAYGDIRTVRVAMSPEDAIRRAEALARDRGWEIARADPGAGLLEATDTSRFFRFKDDVVVRARPAPGGGSFVDMRSISRVGTSDVGVNAKRVRSFLRDLRG
jgi:uncharacterized protein DUF1499